MIADSGAELHIHALKWIDRLWDRRLLENPVTLETANGDVEVQEYGHAFCAGLCMRGLISPTAAENLCSNHALDQEGFVFVQGHGEAAYFHNNMKILLRKDGGLFRLEDPFEKTGECCVCGGTAHLHQCGFRYCWHDVCDQHGVWLRELGITACPHCRGHQNTAAALDQILQDKHNCRCCLEYKTNTHPQIRVCEDCVVDDMVINLDEHDPDCEPGEVRRWETFQKTRATGEIFQASLKKLWVRPDQNVVGYEPEATPPSRGTPERNAGGGAPTVPGPWDHLNEASADPGWLAAQSAALTGPPYNLDLGGLNPDPSFICYGIGRGTFPCLRCSLAGVGRSNSWNCLFGNRPMSITVAAAAEMRETPLVTASENITLTIGDQVIQVATRGELSYVPRVAFYAEDGVPLDHIKSGHKPELADCSTCNSTQLRHAPHRRLDVIPETQLGVLFGYIVV